MSVPVDLQGKKPALLGQALAAHNKSIHTSNERCREAGGLREERIRGMGEGEKRAEVASRDLRGRGRQSDHSDLQEIILLGVLEVFLLG